MSKDDDIPPSERTTMKAPQETRTMAETFGRDTPPEFGPITKVGKRRVVFAGRFGRAPSPEEVTPTTERLPQLERDDRDTDKVHQLGDRVDTQAWMSEGQPLSDGVFEAVMGRLCWTLLASSGILAVAVLAAVYLLRRHD